MTARLPNILTAIRSLRARRHEAPVRQARIAMLAAALLTGMTTEAFAAGSISGRVTGSNAPGGLANIVVQFYDLNTGGDAPPASTTTDGSGNYTVNLPAGSYGVITQATGGYINEIWNNISCSSVCDVNSITAIDVTNAAVTGIDFVLEPGGGRIAGTVTDASTGLPIANVKVLFIDAGEDVPFTSAITDASGNYISDGGSVTGNVFAFTTNSLGYQNEAYDNCKLTSSCSETAIPVTLGATTNGINFALDPGGRVTGRVTNSSNAPVVGIEVTIFDSTGNDDVDISVTDASGNFSSAGLPSGTYYAGTRNFAGLVDKLWNNTLCAGAFCNPRNGTPITVTSPATTSGINFVLPPGGTITGTVTAAAGGAPISNVDVFIMDASGAFVGGDRTNSSGVYGTGALPTGTYFVTASATGYVNQVYNNISCAGFCNTVNVGTKVIVVENTVTNNINFSLVATGTGALASIVGVVRVNGVVTDGVPVQLVGPNNNNVTTVNTGALGCGGNPPCGIFTFSNVAAGSYYVRTNTGGQGINELYPNVTCLACNVTSTPGGTLITVTPGSSTTGIDFDLALGGRISGTVTNTAGGGGLSGIGVQVFTSAGVAGPTFNSTGVSGTYITSGLPPGNYYLRTSNNRPDGTTTYVNELYNDISCPETGCVVTTGTPVTVAGTATTSGIDFQLTQGGRISGTVTNAATSQGIQIPAVQLFSSTGALLGNVRTDSSGNYISSGLPPGTYFARTAAPLVFQNDGTTFSPIDELWDNTSCVPACLIPTLGTPITVSAGTTTTGVNFALSAGGSVSGAVTDAATPGVGLASVQVQLFTSSGAFAKTATTNSAGGYTITGLPADTYYARTSVPGTVFYGDELFSELPCSAGCTPSTGTPIPIVVGAFYGFVNFTLAAGTGTISGTVTDAVTSAAIAGAGVQIYTSSGTLVKTVGAGTGTYSAGGLTPGTYYARTSTPGGVFYLDELYNEMPCSPTCTVTSGTPITVTAGAATTGVNFTLTAGGGSLSGTVTNAAGGAPLSGVQVQVLSSTGIVLGNISSNASGVYTFTGLAPGSFYVRTSGGGTFINQVYNGVVCVNCDVVTSGGTLITVTAGATTSNINFALTTGGRISGTITDAATGAPIQGVQAQLFSSTGVSMGNFNSNASGMYGTSALPAGTYYVRTAVPATQNFIDELWNDLACVPCTVTTGSPVVVTGTATTTGINFALSGGGSISGTVTDAGAGGTPVPAMAIVVFDATGVTVKSNSTTDASGNYTVAGLPNGNYFVVTNPSAGQNYVGQKYNGFPINGLPTTGTPVAVTVDTPRTGVDFALASGGSLSGTVTGDSALPLAGVQIVAYSSAGRALKTVTTDATGGFSMTGLQAGNYYVGTRVGASTPFYVDELYDNVPCLGCAAPAFPNVTLPCTPSCAPTLTTGTSVAITNGTTRTGVNFALASGAGGITGEVTDAVTGIGLLNVQVAIFNAAGAFVKSVTSAANTGGYAVRGLAPGTYYARTIVSPATPYYSDVAYGNTACAPCSIKTTSPITVIANSLTDANFALSSGGSISGLVTDAATTNPLASVDVELFNATGNLVKTTFSGSTGTFRFDGLPSGTYFARTVVSAANHVDELFNNFPCISCAVTSGTGIIVTAGATRDGIDFALVHSLVSVSPSALRFAATKTSASSTFTTVTSAQVVTVAFAGVAGAWTATADQTWVQITSGSGSTSGQFTVSIVNPSNVIGGSTSLSATITVTAGSSSNSPVTIPVTLTVSLPGSTAAPFGSFDTPAAANVDGSIAVTGWALDDVGVDRVEIWRDLAPGETTPPFSAPGHPAHGKVFIANALFVPGARPDVEASYATSPFANRAGWGYLLLTWGLWNQGNGPSTLYAFAFDQEGTATTLGTKAITSSNATATKPFGGIDTPTYGQIVTSSFWNYGWALTPKPNQADSRTCVITNGNVFVGIDSGPLTAVSYGDLRTDIAGAFPGFSNDTGSGGAYYIDTATLTNGTHQIGWYVVDSCGRADGIGSRFFTVVKGAQDNVADGPAHGPAPTQKDVGAAPRGRPTSATVAVRRLNGEWNDVHPTAADVYVIEIDQSERVEVQLPTSDGETYSGAQIVNGETRALPLGSSLDADNGTFYWQPAAGFLGSFDLEFTASYGGPDSDGGPNKVRPNVGQAGPEAAAEAESLRSRPRSSARGGGAPRALIKVVVGPSIRAAIETPSSGAIVQQPFIVAGWALDLAAIDGAGIDAVHVWAYPAAGGDPILIGVADSGGSRPDVAATYGAPFERSAFSLTATGLAPGPYDVVVYAHRASTGTFEGGQSIRVIVP